VRDSRSVFKNCRRKGMIRQKHIIGTKLESAVWRPALEVSSIADGYHPRLIMFLEETVINPKNSPHLNSTFLKHEESRQAD
jgi:hypothetical protein